MCVLVYVCFAAAAHGEEALRLRRIAKKEAEALEELQVGWCGAVAGVVTGCSDAAVAVLRWVRCHAEKKAEELEELQVGQCGAVKCSVLLVLQRSSGHSLDMHLARGGAVEITLCLICGGSLCRCGACYVQVEVVSQVVKAATTGRGMTAGQSCKDW
jgi:hypothetical protein